jgi:hypothetical protein
MNFELHSLEQNGPRSAESSPAGRGVHFNSSRDWCGLRPKVERFSIGGRAIRRILAYGKRDDGKIIPYRFAPPELLHPDYAAYLVEQGEAQLYPPPENQL